MKLKKTIISFCMTFFLGANHLAFAQKNFSLNDVAILLPLPKNLAELKSNYLSSSTILVSGSLISSSNLKLFDWSDVAADLDMRQRNNIERLAVLGIRFDPCFKDQFSDPCRAQIRFVLQPVNFTSQKPDAADLGIHLFFDTTPDKIHELIQFAAQYRNQFLGTGSARAPLQIQPVIQQEGINGKFWQTFKPMIQNVLNQSIPSRIAFFVVHPSGVDWTFRSFNLVNGTAVPIQLPGLNGTTTQLFDNKIQNSTSEFISNIIPRSSPGSDQTFDYLVNSTQFRRSSQRLNNLLITISRLENPGMHLPGTIDCLSCHSTPAIKSSFRKNSIQIQPTVASFISQTLPPSSLINITEDHFEARDFRLFGYRAEVPQIGQRVIHESASLVDQLNQSN